MTGEHNRDRAIERLLREPLLDGVSSQACVDAEALAAWSEGTLSSAEALRVEAHVSQCTRCQSLLAMFARLEPVPAAAEPIWRRWHLRWLVPATAMAAALAIWVAVPPARPASSPAQTAIERERGAVTPPSVARRDGSLDAAVPPAPVPPATDDRKQFKAAPPPPQSGQQGRPAVDAPERDGVRSRQRREADGSVQSEERRPQRPRAAATDSTATLVAPVEQPPTRIGPAETARPSEPAAKADSSFAAAGSLQQRSGADAPTAAPVAAPSSPSAPAVASGAANAIGALPDPAARRFDRAGGSGVPTPFQVESPDARHRWRTDAGGQLQQSSSAGSSWQGIAMTGSDVLTAGMSPEGSVCWLVGRSGAVWVTTDGLRFERRPLPQPIDLISVRASNAREATVVAADGRTYATADGGLSWQD